MVKALRKWRRIQLNTKLVLTADIPKLSLSHSNFMTLSILKELITNMGDLQKHQGKEHFIPIIGVERARCQRMGSNV
jgi:hypothetical protein